MQDKNDFHMDKAFIDHSWQEMRKLLDQEMPEVAIIPWWRRFGWLILLLLGLSLAGGLGAYTIYYQNSLEKPVSKPVATVDSEQPADDHPMDSEENTLMSEAGSEIEAGSKKQEAGYRRQEARSKKQVAGFVGKEDANIAALDFLSSGSFVLDTEANFVVPAIKLNSSIDDLSPLMATEIGVLESEVVILPEELPRKKARKAQFGVHGAFQFQGEIGPEGGVAGLVFQRQLSNSRLYIQTGLNYRYFSDFSYSNSFALSADEDNNGAPVFNDTSGHTEPVSVADLSSESIAKQWYEQRAYLELPLQVQYQLHPRWRVHGGWSINALVSSYPVNGGLFGSSKRDFYPEGAYAPNEALPASPTSFDMAAHGGVTFLATRRLQAQVSYRQGMIPYFTGSKKVRNQSLDLGINFFFNR